MTTEFISQLQTAFDEGYEFYSYDKGKFTFFFFDEQGALESIEIALKKSNMKIYNTPTEVLDTMNEKFKDNGLGQYNYKEAVDMWGIDEPGITDEDVNAWVQHEIDEYNGLI